MNTITEQRRQARWNERILREAAKIEVVRAGFGDPTEAMILTDLSGVRIDGRNVDTAEIWRRLDRLAAERPDMITRPVGERPAAGLRDAFDGITGRDLDRLLNSQ